MKQFKLVNAVSASFVLIGLVLANSDSVFDKWTQEDLADYLRDNKKSLEKYATDSIEDLKKEADELENQGADDTMEVPENEYCFDYIHNDEEAIAFIEAYNRENNIKGAIPKKHESIIARLTVIYAESLKKAPKSKEDVVDAAPEAEKTEE